MQKPVSSFKKKTFNARHLHSSDACGLGLGRLRSEEEQESDDLILTKTDKTLSPTSLSFPDFGCRNSFPF